MFEKSYAEKVKYILGMLIKKQQNKEDVERSFRLRSIIKASVSADISMVLQNSGTEALINCPFISRSRTIVKFMMRNGEKRESIKVSEMLNK